MLRRNRRRKNQAGLTLIEIIFATTIILTSIFAGIAGLTYLNRYLESRKEYSRTVSLVMTVMSTVQSNPAKFHVGRQFLGARDLTSGQVIVPPGLRNPYWAFSLNWFGPASECPGCPYRIGVATEAIPNAPRALLLTVRVSKIRQRKANDPFDPEAAVGPSSTVEYVKEKDYKTLVNY